MDVEQPDTLTLEEIERIAPYFDGLFQLTLSGGEPTLRPDLPDIVRAFNRRRAVPRITLTSNGMMPDLLEKMAHRILIENPFSQLNIALSIDGIAERHDNIRGVPGAFESFLESMKIIRQLHKRFKNLTLVVASTISAFNQDCIPEILEFISQQEDPQVFGMMLARGTTREKEATAVDQERFLVALERLRQIQRSHMGILERAFGETYHLNRVTTIRQRRMVDPCWAGSKLLVLTSTGNLWPCEMLEPLTNQGFPAIEGGFCFGNVRSTDYDVRSLLYSKQAHRIRKYIAEQKCYCTFECALLNNFALNPINYLKAFRHLFKPYADQLHV